jgi:glyoxylase-like metal-dependent hydrolase (beta-lactamase superfamily II)
MNRAREELDPRVMSADGRRLALSFHSFLLQTEGLNIIVDTCQGNHKPRHGFAAIGNQLQTDYLGELRRLGLRREDIDVVFCTHLHYDHIGWNTMLEDGRWVPTFPRARYLMNQRDYDHFSMMLKRNPNFAGMNFIEDSVTPVVAAGLAEFVDATEGFELRPGLRLEAAPGHTPGCTNLQLSSQGARAVFCGDVVHHPVQLLTPELQAFGDIDPALARATRTRVIEQCVEEAAVLLTGHFPAPTAAKVIRAGQSYNFQYA